MGYPDDAETTVDLRFVAQYPPWWRVLAEADERARRWQN
jgi:hypothetical protein